MKRITSYFRHQKKSDKGMREKPENNDRGEQMDWMTCTDAILDKLKFRVLQVDCRKDDHGLNKLMVELRLVKTFLLCARKLGYSCSSVEDSVHENGQQFYSLLVRLENDGLLTRDLAGPASTFREILKKFSQQISEVYVELLDFLLRSGAPPDDELMIFLDSLQDSLVDILWWGRACDSALEQLLNPLHKKFVFLRDFVVFVRSQGKPERKLMEHYGVVALSAARLCCICWFSRDDDKVFDKMHSEISDTIEKMNPVNDRTRLAYIEVLKSATSSLNLFTKTKASILWNFLHSLGGNLTELILNPAAWFTVSLKHQMRILYEGLRFLRIILKKQSHAYDGLHNWITLRHLGGIVCDAGVVIFSLYQNQIQEALAEALDVKMSSLLKEIMRYKEKAEHEFPVPLRFNFTTTNEVGLVDLILEKVKELASCKVDPIYFAKERVDLLRSLPHSYMVHEGDICQDDRGFNKLKVELRLVKTFLLCPMELTHSQYSLKFSVFEKTHQFYSLILGLEDDGLPPGDLVRAASDFRETLKDFRQQINDLYVEMSDSLLQSVSLSRIQRNLRGFVPGDVCWYESGRKSYPSILDRLLESSSTSGDEFMEFFQSLLENLADILVWGESYDSKLEKLFEPLHEKLLFLRNFILFARLQSKHECELMQHCGVLALSAAHLCYVCWFFRDDNQVFDGMQVEVLESVEKIKPVDQQVRLAYIHVLESESSSLSLSTKTDMFIMGDFVDSLLGNLWELLLNCPTNFMVSLKHQMRMLYEGLQYLRNILKTQQEMNDGLPGRFKDHIGAVVNDAGVVIFSLYQNNIQEALAEEIDVKLFCLLERIRVIQAEVKENHPVGVRFNFTTTTVLGIIDLLLEKLKELARCKVDPVYSFAKDRADFLRSYLKKTMDHPTGHLEVYSRSGESVMEQHNKGKKLQPQRAQEDLLFLRLFLENNLEQYVQNKQLQLQTMQDDLLFLRSFLAKNGVQCNHHEELQTLRSRVMEMAYKADFVIDSLRVGDISFYALLLFDNVTSEIQLLKAKTLVVDGNENVIKAQTPTKHLRNASSQEMSMLSGTCLQVSSQASISTMNKAVVDLKDQEQAIIDQLIGGSMQLDVISIVGMPGLGKTFLAQKVYHHPSVTSHFHILAWCCISQTYCKKDLLLGMLSCIDPKAQYSEMNEDDLAHKLCNHLRKQKYLIVLDDIWDIEAWNALKISFPDDTNGSRILLTSRHHGIIGKPHYLRPLDEEESWELLQKRLLTREEGYPPELNVLARQIAKHCNGLPLSIVIISGILLTLDQVGWEEVAERLNSNKKIGATEQCKSILELSYIHLPEHLKPCLIYFAAFSEDQEISVQRLIFLWIAEGFVKKSESENLEKIAEGYIMALINRSLVMVGQQRSIGGVKTCRIHDLLHVFCLRKAKDQNFLQFMRGYDVLHKVEEPYNLCRLSIYSQPKHFVKSRIFCPRMRSLLYSSRGGGSHEVLDHLSFIFHLKLLRVLDLGQISLGSAFPTELSLLVELRYLAVLGWFKDNIPSSLEKLSKLETLFVTTYYSDVGLLLFLDTLMKMQKLRHLHVCGALIDLRLANDNIEYSSILYSLDTFSTVKLYVGQSMEKVMGKFPNIRELKCCLQQSEESSDDSNMIVAMDSLSQLESLKLVLGKVASHLIEFHLPLNIKKLTVEDFSFRTIATIAKLPNLQVLKLLRQADGANEWDMEGMDEEEFFPELKFLKLEDLSMVTWRGSGLHFPSLEKLVLEGCKELEELPSCLWETLTLQLIAVHRCLYSAGDVVRDIQKQQIDYGNKYLKILISEEIEDTLSWSDGDYEG